MSFNLGIRKPQCIFNLHFVAQYNTSSANSGPHGHHQPLCRCWCPLLQLWSFAHSLLWAFRLVNNIKIASPPYCVPKLYCVIRSLRLSPRYTVMVVVVTCWFPIGTEIACLSHAAAVFLNRNWYVFDLLSGTQASLHVYWVGLFVSCGFNWGHRNRKLKSFEWNLCLVREKLVQQENNEVKAEHSKYTPKTDIKFMTVPKVTRFQPQLWFVQLD